MSTINTTGNQAGERFDRSISNEGYNKLYSILISNLRRNLSLKYEPFLFLTIADSGHSSQSLSYAGMDALADRIRQRGKRLTSNLQENFQQLKDNPIRINLQEGDVTQYYIPFEKYVDSNEMPSEQITGSLLNYFDRKPSRRKQWEQDILTAAINTDLYHYYSLPLSTQGHFYGLSHFVLHQEDINKLGVSKTSQSIDSKVFLTRYTRLLALLSTALDRLISPH